MLVTPVRLRFAYGWFAIVSALAVASTGCVSDWNKLRPSLDAAHDGDAADALMGDGAAPGMDVPNACDADLMQSLENCGRCGNQCAFGQVCAMGACACMPPEGPDFCQGECVDTSNNVNNCGQCGQPCQLPNAAYTCQGGQCVIVQCVHNFDDCNHTASDGCESNLMNDSANCGSCGSACNSMQSCVNGACQCLPAFMTCGSVCVDTQSDPVNCGACSHNCGPGVGCVNGQCTSCGAIGQGCCVPGADAGAPCGNGASCMNGTCACSPGTTQCGDVCSTLGDDPLHCGTCTTSCITNHVATATCTAGLCTVATCLAGYTDCNLLYMDGCETPTATDVSRCGSCTHACGTAANATMTCVSGQCMYTCGTNHADCDGVASNGCETNLLNNSAHCGSCANACPSGQLCGFGQCQAQCGAPGQPCCITTPACGPNATCNPNAGCECGNEGEACCAAPATQCSTGTTCCSGMYCSSCCGSCC